MSRFGITADKVRFIVGVGSSDISDSNANDLINDAEYEAERLLKTRFGSHEKEEWFSKSDQSSIYLLKNTPVNRLTTIWANGTGVTPKYVKFDRKSGKVTLTDNAEQTEWSDDEEKDNFIRYEHGRLEKDTTTTKLSSEVDAGDDVTLSVGTGKNIHVDDFIQIVGTGTGSWIGQEEITAVTGTGNNQITVENLQYDHDAGNKITKMKYPDMVKRLSETLAGLMGALHMVGSTYTFATSYSIPEQSVQKGVPYPHFEKVLDRLTKRRDKILEEFQGEFYVA